MIGWPTARPILGHDLSGWNPVKGPALHRPGESFCIVKISQGERVSKYARPHFERGRASGMVMSGYHFADPRGKGKRRPREQAETFVRGLESCGWNLDGHEGQDLIPFADVEWISFGRSKAGKAAGKLFRRQFPASAVMDWTDAFCERALDLTGVLPGVCSGRSFIRYRFRRNERLARYHLWLMSYIDVGKDRQGTPPREYLPSPVQLDGWGPWPVSIHQFTGKGRRGWYRKGKGRIDRNAIYDERGLDLVRTGAQ